MQSLFILGNKRSGTSLLTTILNIHPEIYVSYESDMIWLMYQRYLLLHDLQCYKYDSPEGMNNSLLYVKEELRAKIDNPEDRFYDLQKIIKDNTAWARKKDWNNLRYVGDKKPGQHADPEILKFITGNFDKPKLIHIVRNPVASVYSMHRKARQGMKGAPAFWHKSPDEILKYWVKFELLVLDAKKEHTIFTLRFEDLISNPLITCQCLFGFLGLESPSKQIEAKAFTNPNVQYKGKPLVITDEAREIMKPYDYS